MGKKERLLKKFVKNASESDVKKIRNHLSGMYKGAVKKVWPKVQALYKMIKDGEVSWKSKALAIGTLVYLITPIDALPDVIPGVGLSDDAALIMTTVAVLGGELKKYALDTAEKMAEIEVKKHNRKVRITLISLIAAAIIGIIVKVAISYL